MIFQQYPGTGWSNRSCGIRFWLDENYWMLLFLTDKALLASSIDWHSWLDENTCDCFSCCFSFAINLNSIEHDFSEEEAIFTKSAKPLRKCPPPKSRHSTRSRRGQCWKLINSSSSDFNPLNMSLWLSNRILLSDRIAVVMLKISCGVKWQSSQLSHQ